MTQSMTAIECTETLEDVAVRTSDNYCLYQIKIKNQI